MDTVSLKNVKYTLNSELCTFNGHPVRCKIHVIGRTGTKAPEMCLIEYKGRIYTPYMQKHFKLNAGILATLKIVYSGPTAGLLYSANPFLKMIPKNEQA